MRPPLAAAILLALLSLATVPPARGGEEPTPTPAATPAENLDRLVMKDGRVLLGRIAAEDDAGYALRVDGALRLVLKAEVTEVQRAPAPAPEPAEGADPVGDDGSGDLGPDDRRDKPAREPRRPRRPGKGDDATEGPEEGSPMDGGTPDRPGAGKEGKSRNPRRGDPGERDDGEPRPPAPLSAEMERWIRNGITALGSGDPAVVRSAAAALGAVGRPALPFVKEARRTADPLLLRILDRVEDLLERAPEARPGPDAAVAQRIRSIVDRARGDVALDDARAKTLADALGEYGREFMETLADLRDGILLPEEAQARVAELRNDLRRDLAETFTKEQIAGVDAILDDLARTLQRKPPAIR